MSITSDFNMLRLEAPCNLLQITQDKESTQASLEVSNPAGWMRTMASHQEQAEQDLCQLLDPCNNTVDRTDRRIHAIERAYGKLVQETQYRYERMEANEAVAEKWVRNELMVTANVYQTFDCQVWEAIIERTQEAEVQRLHQTTQVTRMHHAITFLTEANLARNQNMATFQGNVEKWAQAHQKKVNDLEQTQAGTQENLVKVATQVPLPESPKRTTRPTPL